MPDHIEIRGDCFEAIPALQQPFALVLTDPPYGLTRQTWDRPVEWPRWWSLMRRLSCPAAVFASPPFDKHLAMTNPGAYRYDWVWEKTLATGHLNANKRPLQAHELILMFYEKQPTYNPQKTAGHSPVNSFYSRHAGALYGAAIQKRSGGGQTERYPRTVLRMPGVAPAEKKHPNQKPEELLRYLIRTYTCPGEWVLDPFAGSRSTGAAAIAEGRNAVTIELRE